MRLLSVLFILLSVLPLSYAQQSEGSAREWPSSWETHDWSLVHRGTDVGPVRIVLPRQIFTTRSLGAVYATLGNTSDTERLVALERLLIQGGNMAAPLEIPLRPEEILASTPLSTPATVTADGEVVRLSIPPFEIASLTLLLPQIDPTLPEAMRGTCYEATLSGSVEGTAFEMAGELCWGERIPLH